MTRKEILEKIEQGEWQHVELKKSDKKASKNALRTVSAFANTEGGYIIFGVTESQGNYVISGVKDVNVIQDNFLAMIDDQGTFSVKLNISNGVESIRGKRILWFYIPEVPAREKPVFSNGVPYIREGASTRRCRGDEVARFSRNASEIPHDIETLDIDPELFYDTDTLKWYRSQVENRNSDLDPKASDMDFLRDTGFLVEEKDQHLPTRAAVLILGKKRYISQRLQRFVVDLQYYNCVRGEESSDTGWIDREEIGGNLIDAWRAIEEFFDRHTDHPFALDHQTRRRIDTSPGSVAFREATTNLLVHQDYGDLQQSTVIQIFRDGVNFSNPGDAFDSRESLLVSGSKNVRNPSIAVGFRRLGLSEQVGFGITKIYRDWRNLGYMPPEITIDKHRRRFNLWFPRVALIGEEQQHKIDNIGIDITNAESTVYAFVLQKGSADLADIMGLTNRSSMESLDLAGNLVSKGLLIRDSSRDPAFLLAPETGNRGTRESSVAGSTYVKTARKGSKLGTDGHTEVGRREKQDLKPPQRKIIENAEKPMPLSYFMNLVGYKNRGDFNRNHLRPLINNGLIEMTFPDSPTSPEQRYFLTKEGKQLRRRLLKIDDRS